MNTNPNGHGPSRPVNGRGSNQSIGGRGSNQSIGGHGSSRSINGNGSSQSISGRGSSRSISGSDLQERRSFIFDISNVMSALGLRRWSSSVATTPAPPFQSGEVIPKMANYRKSVCEHVSYRLTLDELLNNNGNEKKGKSTERLSSQPNAAATKKGKVIKLNWVEGVFMTCLLNIWGVMLFLRLTWVIGQAGLVEGLLIMTLSNMVTFITGLSMSAVSTNGQITGGGIYYMISRSLGPEFGGAIGLMFVLAQSMAVAMHLIGFCESLLDMIIEYMSNFESILNAGRMNDIRLIGMITLLFILGVILIGMDWMTRVQIVLLIILVAAQVDFVVGSMLSPTLEQRSKGFVGYSENNYKENLWSAYTTNEQTGNLHTFFSIFAVYFPSCTGIVAGANLSGDLKDPSAAIPKGTLLAIGTTYFTYILYGILSAGCSVRYASGIENEYLFSQNMLNTSFAKEMNITQAFNNCTNRDCKYGLIPSQQMIETISGWGPLIYCGCFAATLSSGIACLAGAPRVLQAMAKDKLYPGIVFFAKGHGANNDPFRGYGLVFFIAAICIVVGDLNQVSSVLSNFYVASYALINFSVFHASITQSPGWRPTFKFYNKWLSLAGTIMCFVVMFLMDYRTAAATIICILLLYIIVRANKPDANWGSSDQSLSFISALRLAHSLEKVDEHVKTYRPKIILMCGEPSKRPSLVDFANLITKKISLLQCVSVFECEYTWEEIKENKKENVKWLEENNIQAFYTMVTEQGFFQGARLAIQTVGIGKLSPNMLLIGFQEKWMSSVQDSHDYVKILQSAFDQHLSVGILRVRGGFNLTKMGVENEAFEMDGRESGLQTSHVGSHDRSFDSGCGKSSFEDVGGSSSVRGPTRATKGKLTNFWPFKRSFTPSQKTVSVFSENTREHRPFKNKENPNMGTIDIYWLFDDGGLTLLLPYILKTRAKFAQCRMRVFCLAENMDNVVEETQNLTTLLEKFRIEFQDVTLIANAYTQANTSTKNQFEDLLSKIQSPNNHSSSGRMKAALSSEDVSRHKETTNFHLRLSEIVQEHSRKSDLIIMTLPIPTKTGLPHLLYMAWLDFLSWDLPPFLFLRGNQSSVLTFYS